LKTLKNEYLGVMSGRAWNAIQTGEPECPNGHTDLCVRTRVRTRKGHEQDTSSRMLNLRRLAGQPLTVSEHCAK